MSEAIANWGEIANGWCEENSPAVALHLRQRLLPAEGADGADGVIFPPTYLGIGYNIDELADGTKVATIDSVGSQANRMEPTFLRGACAALVPQIWFTYADGQRVSILDVGHRLGDALVRSSELADRAKNAFESFKKGDSAPMAKLAPTSLLFGVWDSRGGGAKPPRIVQSVIRAWDVSELHRSAVYVPPLDYAALGVFSDEDKGKEEVGRKSPLAQRGFVHNPAGELPGGVAVHGPILRDTTVNLIALRRLEGSDSGNLRRYILGLGLVAASVPLDGFLRQGCLLTLDPAQPARWEVVERSGERRQFDLRAEDALAFAQRAARAFGVGEGCDAKFEAKRAKADLGEVKKARGKKGAGAADSEPAAGA